MLALSLVTGFVARFPGPGPFRLEIGAFDRPLLDPSWSRSDRADIDSQAAADAVTSFYYRVLSARGRASLPLVAPHGPLKLTLRATARVRSALAVFVGGSPAGELLIRPGPWDRYALEVPSVPGAPLDLGLALRPLPLVRGEHVLNPQVPVDYIEVAAPAGLLLPIGTCLAFGGLPLLVFGFARAVGFSARLSLIGGATSTVAALTLERLALVPTLLALPRLVPAALLAAGVLHLLSRRLVPAEHRPSLTALVAVGVLFHGSVVFFPNHNPPDIDIHARRTFDLGGVPLEYRALLRYGSQLPTASQDQGAATVALGERTLIPYSPLPYVAYYALHRLGLDLYWAMTVLNVVFAMGVVPLAWAATARLWSPEAAWLASILYTLDLAVWHHAGRSHAPAVLGGALGTVALLYLVMCAERVATPRRIGTTAVVLAAAVLGYSSLVVLFGLFGLVLLVLLASDARAVPPAQGRGLTAALVIGGLLAGALFYFHYVPGLLRGAAGVEAEPDLFPGKTFFIFHNESRQSLRVWVLGYWIPLLAGLVAAPLAWRRARPASRPILASWFAAWALIMFLKEPFLFPKLLRWAKEDQFLSPLLCLLIAGAAWSLPRAWMRWGSALVAVGMALWLQIRDFAHHANSLRL